jgi:hypothetical protein
MEMVPDTRRYFVMGTTDDERGVNLTMAVQPGTSLAVQMLASTPLLVTILNAVLAGVILTLAAIQMGAESGIALTAGAVGFILTVAGFTWYASRDIARGIAEHQPQFPGDEAEEAPLNDG